MKSLNKLSVQLWMAVILIVFGILLIVASFIVPPLGIIDSSVLVAYGETLTFVGALVGVDYSYKYKLRDR
jgi:membrane-bound ClpP family serine protease